MRLVPMSGAGGIKGDAVDERTVLEVKDANVSFALNSAYLATLHHQAVVQGKDAVMVIEFANGMEAEIHVHKRRYS